MGTQHKIFVSKLYECGYEEAALGFSLSYKTSIDRAKAILPKYAFGVPGENKFLESIIVYLDITAPRYWWQEFDTYRVGVTKQSESTMHTLTKRPLQIDDFEFITDEYLVYLNKLIEDYKNADKDTRTEKLILLKSSLPEGFLQRRIVCTNYKTLQNIVIQRSNHRLPHWKTFISFLLENLEHPEFLIQP